MDWKQELENQKAKLGTQKSVPVSGKKGTEVGRTLKSAGKQLLQSGTGLKKFVDDTLESGLYKENTLVDKIFSKSPLLSSQYDKAVSGAKQGWLNREQVITSRLNKRQASIDDISKDLYINKKSFGQAVKDVDLKYIGLQAINQLPQLLVSAGAVAAAPYTGGASIGALGGQYTGGEYLRLSDKAKEFGQEVDGKTRALALGSGTIQAALDRLPFLKYIGDTGLTQSILKKELAESLSKKAIARIGVGAIEEGSTEALQQITANAFEKVYNKDKNIFDDAMENFVAGAILGGTFDTVFQATGLGIKHFKDQKSGGDIVTNVNNYTQQYIKELETGTINPATITSLNLEKQKMDLYEQVNKQNVLNIETDSFVSNINILPITVNGKEMYQAEVTLAPVNGEMIPPIKTEFFETEQEAFDSLKEIAPQEVIDNPQFKKVINGIDTETDTEQDITVDSTQSDIQKAKAAGKTFDEFSKEQGAIGDSIGNAMQKEFELEKLTDELSKKANSFAGDNGLVENKTPEYLQVKSELDKAMREYKDFKSSELGKIIIQERRKLPINIRMKMLKGDIKTKSQLKAEWDSIQDPAFKETTAETMRENLTPKEKELLNKEVSFKEVLPELNNILNKIGIQTTVNIFDNIYTGGKNKDMTPEQAFGMYFDKELSLASRTTMFIHNHEVSHMVLDNMDNMSLFKDIGISQSDVFNALREEYGNKSKADLDEILAVLVEKDAMNRYLKRKSDTRGVIKKYIDALLDFISDFLGNSKNLTVLEKYIEVINGDKNYKTNKVKLSGTGKSAKYSIKPTEIQQDNALFKSIESTNLNQIKDFLKKTIDNTMSKYKKDRIESLIDSEQKIKDSIKEGKGKLQDSYNLINTKLKEIKGNKTLSKEYKKNVRKEIKEQRKYNKEIKGDIKQQRLAITETKKETYNEVENTKEELYKLADSIKTERGVFNVLAELRNYEVKQKLKVQTDGEKIRKVTMLQTLKDLYRLDPVIIKDIKKSKGITGNIQDMTITQIESFVEEAKKRYEFAEKNGYFALPTRDVVVGSFAKITKGKQTKAFSKEAKSGVKKYAQLLQDRVTGKIKELFGSYEFDNNTINEKYKKLSVPYTTLIGDLYKHKITNEQQAVLNSRFGDGKDNVELRGIIHAIHTNLFYPGQTDTKYADMLYDLGDILGYDIRNSYSQLKELVFDSIHADSISQNIGVNYVGMYFPRIVRNDVPRDNYIAAVKRQLEKKYRVPYEQLSQDIKDKFVNNIVTRDSAKLKSSGISAMESSRELGEITDIELLNMFQEPIEAIDSYINRSTTAYLRKKYFNVDTEKQDGVDELGRVISQLIDNNTITNAEIAEVINVYNAYFSKDDSSVLAQRYRTLVYVLAMNKFTSAITQLGEVIPTIWNTGIQGNPFDTRIKPVDIGAETDTVLKQELLNNDKFSQFLLKHISLSDTPGFVLLINNSAKGVLSAVKSYKKGNSYNKNYIQKIHDIYGVNAPAVINKLSQFNYSSTEPVPVELLRITRSVVGDYRTLGRLQKTESAVRNPGFWVLKNFMMSTLNVLYRNGISPMAEGYKTKDVKKFSSGLKNTIGLLSAYGTSTYLTGMLKDLIIGNERDDEVKEFLFSVLGVFGINRYTGYVFERQGFGASVLNIATPASATVPLGLASNVIKTIEAAIEGDNDYKSVKDLPWVGNIIYNRTKE